jgi:hypothetical protein
MFSPDLRLYAVKSAGTTENLRPEVVLLGRRDLSLVPSMRKNRE